MMEIHHFTGHRGRYFVSDHYTQLGIIAGAALAAPLLSGLPKNFRLPVVVIELLLGVLLGPHLLHLAEPTGIVKELSELGLTFLLFMVGFEIDPKILKGPALNKAITGWILSFILGLVLMALFHSAGWITAPPLLAAVGLSTTALGILVPILEDEKELDSDFGQWFLPAATLGEFGPLMVISVLLIPAHTTVLHTLFITSFIALAFLSAFGAHHPTTRVWTEKLSEALPESGEFQVRLCMLIQAIFIALAAIFGLNVVIGAFAAGLIVGLATRDQARTSLKEKLHGIGYGFLIPFFFIVAGMSIDPSQLLSSPLLIFQVAGLLVLLLIIRGVPVFLYRHELSLIDKARFTLFSATGLPIIVIITEIGIDSQLMRPERATALLCAGMLSVVIFPQLAKRISDHPPAFLKSPTDAY